MSKEIQLTQGKVAIVDDEDFDWLSQYKWYAAKQDHTFYAHRKIYLGGGRKNQKSKTIRMHREILQPPPNMETDHRDLDGLNNRRNNLRIATSAQNLYNQKPQTLEKTSSHKGVYWHQGAHKWASCIHVKRQGIHLGLFTSEIEAAKAYDKEAKKYFGEFARTNF